MLETQSVDSLESVKVDESPNTAPRQRVLNQCLLGAVKVQKKGNSPSESKKSKTQTLDFYRLSIGSNCSKSSQRKQQSGETRLKQHELDLEMMELNISQFKLGQSQRQKEEELQKLFEKTQFPELEDKIHQCSGYREHTTFAYSKVVDGAKERHLESNSVAGFEARSECVGIESWSLIAIPN